MTHFTVLAHAFFGVIYKECVPHWLENTAKYTQTPPEHTQTPPKHRQTQPEHTQTSPEHTQTPPEHTQTPPEHTQTPPEHTQTLRQMNTPPSKARVFAPLLKAEEKLCFSCWVSTNIDSDLKQKWLHPMPNEFIYFFEGFRLLYENKSPSCINGLNYLRSLKFYIYW